MATFEDRDQLIELGSQFMREYQHTKHVVTDVRERVTQAVTKVLEEGVAVVAEDRAGQVVAVLGFLMGVHPITGVLTAMEVAWYVHKSQRGGSIAVRLVREAELMALNAGAKRLQIGAPDDHVAVFLNRLEYQVGETTFFKELV